MVWRKEARSVEAEGSDPRPVRTMIAARARRRAFVVFFTGVVDPFREDGATTRGVFSR